MKEKDKKFEVELVNCLTSKEVNDLRISYRIESDPVQCFDGTASITADLRNITIKAPGQTCKSIADATLEAPDKLGTLCTQKQCGDYRRRRERNLLEEASLSLSTDHPSYDEKFKTDFLKKCADAEYEGSLHVERHVMVIGAPTQKAVDAGCPYIMTHDAIDKETNEHKKWIMTWEHSHDELNAWAVDKCTPLVREITFENAEELTEEGLPFLILFHHPDDNASIKRFTDMVQRELMEDKRKKQHTIVPLFAVLNFVLLLQKMSTF